MVSHTLFNWHMLGRITGPTLTALRISGKTDSVRIYNELVDDVTVAELALVNGTGDFTNSADLDIIF